MQKISNILKQKKVFVGISGGVDSAVAAALLKEQGYDVYGVFMKNWSGSDYGLEDNCPWKEDLEASIQVCNHLGIPHRTYNFEKEYRANVIEEFFEEYKRGNTPNPDVLCNTFIKFDAFLKRAIDDGADFIATGHYTRIKDGILHKAEDTNKDQTYFLAGVAKKNFSKALFPLGDLTKKEVREYAEKLKLPNSKRPDSQGICFIGKVEMDEFLALEISHKQGEIVDIDTNKVVGTHKGIWFYTLGQRKGLDIGGLSEPYFVADKNVTENILYVAAGKQNPHLWKKVITVEKYNLLNEITDINNLTATIRYRAPDSKVSITKGTATSPIEFTFDNPLWTPAVGQYLVLFEGSACVGSGRIIKMQ